MRLFASELHPSPVQGQSSTDPCLVQEESPGILTPHILTRILPPSRSKSTHTNNISILLTLLI